MSNKDILEASLVRIESLFDLSRASVDKETLKELHDTAKSYKYKIDQDTSDGFKLVVSTDRDVIAGVDGSVPDQVTKQIAVVQLDASAKKNELIKKVGADQTDLGTITGDTRLSSNGFLDVVISAPFPEALAEVIKETTEANSDQIKSIVESNLKTELSKDNIIDSVLADVLGDAGGFSELNLKAVENQISSLQRSLKISASGFNGLLENLVEEAFKPASNLLQTIAKKGDVKKTIPPEDIKEIVRFRLQNKISKAINVLKKYSDASDAELKAIILKIDNRAANQLEPDAVTVDIPVKRTDDFLNVWREETTDTSTKIFDSISEPLEVEQELSNLKREVTEVIIQGFNVTTGGTVRIEEWHELYKKKYNQGFNPHIYINNKGVAFRGRPLEIKTSDILYQGTIDHSERSILILLEEPNQKPTASQIITLKKILRHIYNAKPGIQVFGLYEIQKSTESPWWDVSLLIKQNFNKENIKDFDPSENPPLTQKELVEGYVGK